MKGRSLGIVVLGGLLAGAWGCDSECSGLQLNVDDECGGFLASGEQEGTDEFQEPTLAPRALRSSAKPARWASSRAMALRGQTLYVVDQDNDALVVMDRESGRVIRSLALKDHPYHVIVGPDGAIYATERYAGSVVRIEPEGSAVSVRADVGGGPTSLAMSTLGDVLYVSLTESDAVVALDPATLQETGRAEVARPRAVTTTTSSQGEAVTVTSEHPWISHIKARWIEGRLELDLDRHTSLRTNNPLETSFSFNVRQSRQNAAFAAVSHPETNVVLVAHQLAFPGGENEKVTRPSQADTSYGGGGGPAVDVGKPVEVTVTPAVDQPGGNVDRPVLRSDTLDVSMPTDINHHPTITLALVTASGTNNLLALNTTVGDPMASPLGVIKVGKAPRAVVFSEDGALAYVLDGHDFTISVVDMAPFLDIASPGDGPLKERLVADSLRLSRDRAFRFGVDPLPLDARLGRDIFTNNNYRGLSHQGSFACQSCHPEGAEDRVVWLGAIGPRQTPSLAGRLIDTAPFNWVGSEADLTDNFVRTVSRMGGTGLTSPEMASLERFVLDGLTRPPNPNLRPDGLTEQQAYGRALFYNPSIGCGSCHSGAALTDGLAHDVGTVSDAEIALAEGGLLDVDSLGTYDTPSLRDLYRSAPYLHDGSAPTLMDVLDRTSTTMGRTDHLSVEQKQAIVDFMTTL